MNRHIPLLLVVLGVQAAIIAATVIVTARSSSDASPSLLTFDGGAVDTLVIGGEQAGVTLTRKGGNWQVGDGLPADQGKVAELIEAFGHMDAAWPVATSAQTAERFEVTEDSHQRVLTFASGDETLARVFLGTSPGYRRVHARVDGHDEVYSIAYSNYQAATDVDGWLDKALLQPAGAVRSIAASEGWRLRRGDDGSWSLDGVAADQNAAADLANRLGGLRVMGVTQAPEDTTADYTLEVEDDEGAFTLAVVEGEDSDARMNSTRRPDRWFRVAEYTMNQLRMERDSLASHEPEPSETQGDPMESHAKPPVPASSSDAGG